MRAVRFTGCGGLEIVECDVPRPASNEVRVRLAGTGVCASNLPVWEGRPWFHYPLDPGAPGHEGWGTVDAVGDDVSRALVGRRVALLSTRAYAEWDVTDVSRVVPIPDTLAGVPCPAEPLACAVNVLRRAQVQPDETVVIVGIGFLGALLVRLASDRGARVVAVSRRPFARQIAARLGAAATVPFDERHETARAVAADLAGPSGHADAPRDGASCVIECVGSQDALDLATDLTGTRGRLVIAGYHQDGPRQVDLQTWNWRGLDVVNAHERDERVYVRGMLEALSLLARGRLDLTPLVTHTVPLDRLDESFRLMQARPDGFLKACVLFGNGG